MIERASHFYLSSESRMSQTVGGFGRFKKILFLEQDITTREMLKRILVERSFDVTCLGNVPDAICELLEMDVDVILCDLTVPDLPCEMFYRAVERFKPYLCRRFVFLTATSAGMELNRFVRQLKAQVVWKPFQPGTLLETIGEILEKNEAGLSREITV